MRMSSRLLAASALCLFAMSLHTPASAQNTPTPPAPAPPPPAAPVNPAQPVPLGPTKPVPVQPANPQIPATKPVTPTDAPSGNARPPNESAAAPVLPPPAETAEIPEPTCTDLSCADSNRDGKLSPEELAAIGDPTLSFEALDNDRNGSIDDNEWERHAQINPRDPPPQ